MSSKTQIVQLIRDHVRDWGYPPTVRWLGEQLGLAPATIHQHLVDLEHAGAIVREPNKPRAMRLREE